MPSRFSHGSHASQRAPRDSSHRRHASDSAPEQALLPASHVAALPFKHTLRFEGISEPLWTLNLLVRLVL